MEISITAFATDRGLGRPAGVLIAAQAAASFAAGSGTERATTPLPPADRYVRLSFLLLWASCHSCH